MTQAFYVGNGSPKQHIINANSRVLSKAFRTGFSKPSQGADIELHLLFNDKLLDLSAVFALNLHEIQSLGRVFKADLMDS